FLMEAPDFRPGFAGVPFTGGHPVTPPLPSPSRGGSRLALSPTVTPWSARASSRFVQGAVTTLLTGINATPESESRREQAAALQRSSLAPIMAGCLPSRPCSMQGREEPTGEPRTFLYS